MQSLHPSAGIDALYSAASACAPLSTPARPVGSTARSSCPCTYAYRFRSALPGLCTASGSALAHVPSAGTKYRFPNNDDPDATSPPAHTSTRSRTRGHAGARHLVIVYIDAAHVPRRIVDRTHAPPRAAKEGRSSAVLGAPPVLAPEALPQPFSAGARKRSEPRGAARNGRVSRPCRQPRGCSPRLEHAPSRGRRDGATPLSARPGRTLQQGFDRVAACEVGTLPERGPRCEET